MADRNGASRCGICGAVLICNQRAAVRIPTLGRAPGRHGRGSSKVNLSETQREGSRSDCPDKVNCLEEAREGGLGRGGPLRPEGEGADWAVGYPFDRRKKGPWGDKDVYPPLCCACRDRLIQSVQNAKGGDVMTVKTGQESRKELEAALEQALQAAFGVDLAYIVQAVQEKKEREQVDGHDDR